MKGFGLSDKAKAGLKYRTDFRYRLVWVVLVLLAISQIVFVASVVGVGYSKLDESKLQAEIDELRAKNKAEQDGAMAVVRQWNTVQMWLASVTNRVAFSRVLDRVQSSIPAELVLSRFQVGLRAPAGTNAPAPGDYQLVLEGVAHGDRAEEVVRRWMDTLEAAHRDEELKLKLTQFSDSTPAELLARQPANTPKNFTFAVEGQLHACRNCFKP